MERKESHKGERMRPQKAAKYIVIGIFVCAVVLGVGYYMGSRQDKAKQEELTAVVVQNQISAMSELATVTYAYTELGQYESSKDFYGVKVPFTTNGFILTYDGIIKAGIDMTKVEAEVDAGTGKVVITLPEAEVLSHEIDEDSVKIFDEKTSIFNPFTVKDYTEFYADQKAEVEKKALAKGLLTEAKTQAQTMIQAALETYLTEDWSLEIR